VVSAYDTSLSTLSFTNGAVSVAATTETNKVLMIFADGIDLFSS
jgi:hypothetical protein